MSRQLISSEKFPTKPHNCKIETIDLWTSHWYNSAGPAVKVPGLVFCAGQTATGEIKQATVGETLRSLYVPFTYSILAKSSPEFERGPRALRLFLGAGRQIQCIPGRHEGFRRDEWGLYRVSPSAHALTELLAGGRTRRGNGHRDWVHRTGLSWIITVGHGIDSCDMMAGCMIRNDTKVSHEQKHVSLRLVFTTCVEVITCPFYG